MSTFSKIAALGVTVLAHLMLLWAQSIDGGHGPPGAITRAILGGGGLLVATAMHVVAAVYAWWRRIRPKSTRLLLTAATTATLLAAVFIVLPLERWTPLLIALQLAHVAGLGALFFGPRQSG